MSNSCLISDTIKNTKNIMNIKNLPVFNELILKTDMFHVNNFKITNTDNETNIKPTKKESIFIITPNTKGQKNNLQNSLVVAAKPLILLASIFGSQLVKYKKNDIVRKKWLNKLYSLFVISGYATLTLVIRPASWQYTKTDIPLNILTKTYGMFNIIEAIYSIFTISFCSTNNFVRLFKKLDEIDNHLFCSKLVFQRRRLISIFFAIMPILLAQSTLWLVKFRIQNIGAHLTFFLITLQGAVVSFIVFNIFIKHLSLNKILMKRVKLTISKQKDVIFRDTICDSIINIICKEPKVIQNNDLKYCWFELMQIYDKLADCIHLFNEIYCGQVFWMYNSWLLCTLLVICRSLSPSIKYSEVFLNDLFMYSCVNSRPIFLAVICEMFIKERKKTLSLLLHILLLPGRDHAYFSQVETMIMLVLCRKLEISANVFTVNVPTVMNFAGRIISYTVLIIQYFYNNVFSE